MGLLDWLSNVTDFFSDGPEYSAYADPSNFGMDYVDPFYAASADPSNLGEGIGILGGSYDPFMDAVSNLPGPGPSEGGYQIFDPTPEFSLQGLEGSSVGSGAGGVSSGGFDFALSPAQQQSVNDAIGRMTRGALPSGRSGGGVALNTLLNLPATEVPDVPKVTVPSLEGPPPPPAGAEPLPFKPLAVETTTPAQAPRALDRLAGTVPPEAFPESRALDARRRLRV